jgi:hypothetical protein
MVKRFLFAVVLICAHTLTAPISNAFETRCSAQPDYLLESPDIWESKNSQDLSYKVSWKLRDPESCITGIGISKATLNGYPSQSEIISTNFTFERLKDSVIVSSQVIINQKSLESLANKDIDRKGYDLIGGVKIEVELIRDEPKGKNTYVLQGDYSLKNLWSDWFAKLKGTYSDACSGLLVNGQNEGKWNALTGGGNFIPSGAPSLKSVTDGKFIYQLVIPNANCIDWVYAGPVSKPSYGSLIENSKVSVWKSLYDNFALGYVGDAYLHANYPFWAGTSSEYFQGIKSDDSFVKVFTSKCPAASSYLRPCVFDKWTNLQTEQKFSRVGSDIVIDISISQNSLEQNYREEGYLSFFHGSYSRFSSKGFEYSGRGWSTSCSTIGKTTTCRSNPPTTGGTRAASTDVAFQSTLSVFENPVLVAEKKAKADAELKAKQEALSQHKQSCLQHNIEVEKLSERFNQLKKLYPSKVGSYFKDRNLDPNIFIDSSRNCSGFENDLSAFTFERTKAFWARDLTIWAQDLARDEERLVKLELAVKVDKKTTITCVKGKQTKKVTAVKPVCPAGYKKK